MAMRVALLLPWMALLSACATNADRAAYLNSLVGRSETEAVRQLGVPDRTVATGNRMFLAYGARRSATFFAGSVAPGFYGSGYYPGWPDAIVTRDCETTLEIAGDRVVTWSLRGLACG